MTAQTILPANSVRGGDLVTNSCIFDGSSAYMHKTPGSAGNTKLWTWSAWIKKSLPDGADLGIFGQYIDANNFFRIRYRSDQRLQVDNYTSGSATFSVILGSNNEHRDISAWYHLVVAYDSAQGTDSNRVKIYVNGVLQTVFQAATYPNQNVVTTLPVDGTRIELGRTTDNQFFNGYFAEVVLIDGTALAPTSFGEFDSDTPTVWKPIDVSGLTRGDQGFYLDFEDSSALGNDKGGSNNFGTVTNLAAIDQSIDTCINNYPTFNSLDNFYNDDTLSQANQTMTGNSQQAHRIGTIGLSAGKWYWEVRASTWQTANQSGVGIAAEGPTATDYEFYNQSGTIVGYAYYSNGAVYGNGSTIVSGGGYTFNNASSIIVGVALNLTDNKLAWSHNGTWQGSTDPGAGTTNMLAITAPSSTKNGVYFPACKQKTNNRVLDINFGSPGFSISSSNADANDHGNFEYEVPSGYFAINTKNLAEYG